MSAVIRISRLNECLVALCVSAGIVTCLRAIRSRCSHSGPRWRAPGLLLIALGAIGVANAAESATPVVPRFTPEMQTWVDNFKSANNDLRSSIKPLAPVESQRLLNPATGYEAVLVANEPLVRQPIDLSFDERGRLWVVQLLQYPFPAGIA